MFTKAQIIDEIRRTAEANGGRPLGTARFETETGIGKSDWEGKLWARWGDALVEAGFKPNTLKGPRNEVELLECLARLARELGRIPTNLDIKLKGRSEPGFPAHNTVAKLGPRHVLTEQLRQFSAHRGWTDMVAICDAKLAENAAKGNRLSEPVSKVAVEVVGFVYLLRSGCHYKIGRSNAAGRRERELQIQLPEKAEIVHEIKSDDPVGIERYWHQRFADQRKNGEWFDLSAKDVAAFKRRKFM